MMISRSAPQKLNASIGALLRRPEPRKCAEDRPVHLAAILPSALDGLATPLLLYMLPRSCST